MTKKHFIAVAQIIDNTHTKGCGNADVRANAAVDSIANRLAEYFASENPRFDRDRFLKACGV